MKTNNNIILILCISIVLLSSCQSLYQAGYAGSEYHHLETPFCHADTTVTAHYLEGGIQEGVEYYKNEKNDLQYLGYRYAISGRYFGFAVGGNAFHGNYKVNSFVDDMAHLNNSYDYWGGEFYAKTNLNIPITQFFHWRVIGAQISWNMERGPFYDFRDDLVKLDEEMEMGTTFFDSAASFSFYVDSEFLFNQAKDFYLGLSSALGTSMKYVNLSFVGGISLEYKGVGLKCSYREGTPSLVRATLSAFDNTVNNNVNYYQYSVYYKF